MPRAGSFYARRREWSKRKHQVLLNYLGAATRILGSRFGDVYFVDGFAGPGYYEDGAPGSPVLAAQHAAEITRPYRLRLINVEVDEKLFQQLEQHTTPIAPTLVTNFCCSFEAAIPQILKLLGNLPAFFFVDPFGVKDIPWDALEPVLRRPYTDALINFHGRTAGQLAGLFFSQVRRSSSYGERLNKVLGTDVWQSQVEPSDKKREPIIQCYLEQVAKARGIACRHDVRDATNRRYKYSLIFASRARVAFHIMNDILYRTEREYEKAVERLTIQRALPGLEEQFRAQAEQTLAGELKEHLYSLGRAKGRVLYDDLRFEAYRHWFARAKGSHYLAAVKELIQEGKIRRGRLTGVKPTEWLEFI